MIQREVARAFARLAWVANFGGMFAMSAIWFLFPQLVVSLGVPADSHGVLLAFGRGITISVFVLMHFFQFWRFRFLTAVAAQSLGVAGLVMVSVATTEILLAGGIAALSAMMGYNYFASLSYHAIGYADQQRGTAFGLQEAFLGFGAAGGSCFRWNCRRLLGRERPVSTRGWTGRQFDCCAVGTLVAACLPYATSANSQRNGTVRIETINCCLTSITQA